MRSSLSRVWYSSTSFFYYFFYTSYQPSQQVSYQNYNLLRKLVSQKKELPSAHQKKIKLDIKNNLITLLNKQAKK